MPITLAEAKAALSVYVDNGVYSNDARVTDRINEAQRRLYAKRAWLGVMAKFSVPTVAGNFSLPNYNGYPGNVGTLTNFSDFGLATVLRVSGTTAPAGFLTNSEQAFLADNQTLLKVSRLIGSSDYRTYQLSGVNPVPALVEVTGKLQFQPATNGTDLLIIQDLDALRLMLLGLWREQNGQLDLAKVFEDKAVDQLSTVLEKTLEVARRLNYQSTILSSSPGTMGHMRARLALDLKDGLHTDDTMLFHVLDKAEEILMTKGKWFGTIGQYTISVPTDGEIYLPTEVDSILFVDYEGSRVDLFAREFDFHENGPGYRTATNTYQSVVIDRGEEQVFNAGTGLYETRRKYFVDKAAGPSGSNDITILAKKRFLPKQNDLSEMTIKNYPALYMMVVALLQSDKPDFYQFHEAKAVELLRSELLEKRGGARLNMQVQGRGYGMGEIEAII